MDRFRATIVARLLAVLAGVLLLGFPACATVPRTINVADFGPANRIEVYENGRPVVDRVVAPGSAEDRAVAAWLQSHASGWRPTVVDYAPGNRVRGAEFDLNFQAGRCVLNYRVDERAHWSQVVRQIEPDDPIPQVFNRGH